METIKNRWDVLSPDGFSISMSDTYDNPKKALEAFNEWLKRYEHQGYYSSVKYGKIPLNKVVNHIKIIQYKSEE